jgi:hypothetical protein
VFTVEIHHGGLFDGFGELRSYVGEKIDWSALWFEDFLQQLGYDNDPRIKFYWLLPEKQLLMGLESLHHIMTPMLCQQ